MRHLILAALCIWSSIPTVTPELNEKQVDTVTKYIKQHFTGRFNYQHAYFVVFTEDECNRGLTDAVLKEALKNENAQVMFKEVDSFCIHSGNRMVIASFLKYERNNNEYTLHSEYRLLDPNNNSPITHLLSGISSPGCTIFYSQSSPCTTKCLLPDGGSNIIKKLEEATGLPEDKVFAFNQLFWNDKHQDKKEQDKVWEAWKSLDKYMRLFQCNGRDCLHCFKNGVQQNRCYN